MEERLSKILFKNKSQESSYPPWRTTKKPLTFVNGFFVSKLFIMEEFVVYILYSEKFDKNYTGFTSNLIERFKSHNELGIKGYTLKFRPWKVIHVEFFDLKSEAMKREKFLKTGSGRTFIKNFIQK